MENIYDDTYSKRSLENPKDHKDNPTRSSDVDVASAGQSVTDDKTGIEIESIDRHVSREEKNKVRQLGGARADRRRGRSVISDFATGQLRHKVYRTPYRVPIDVREIDFDFGHCLQCQCA